MGDRRRARTISLVKKCRSSAASFVSGRSGAHAALAIRSVMRAPGASMPSSEQRSGKLPLKWLVSTSTAPTVPRAPSWIRIQSWPGARACAASPSRRPCSRRGRAGAGCSSGRRTRPSRRARAPPFSTAARSTQLGRHVRRGLGVERRRDPVGGDPAVDAEARHAAVGEDVEPHVRDRRRRGAAREQVLRVGPQRLCGSSSLQLARRAAPSSGVPARRVQRPRPRRTAGGCRGSGGCRCRSRAPSPGAPSSSTHQSWPGHALAAALPAVHPLAAVGVLALDEDAAPGLEQVLRRRRRSRRWRRAPCRRARRRRDRRGR